MRSRAGRLGTRPDALHAGTVPPAASWRPRGEALLAKQVLSLKARPKTWKAPPKAESCSRSFLPFGLGSHVGGTK